MTSIRNVSVEIASTRILQYLQTHNYDDCVIYINRLSPNTFRKTLPDLPIDTLFAQLPFSIEICEAIYSKVFITDPDTFPIRTLKPEQLLSKIISIFSFSSASTKIKSKEADIDDEHLLSNLASILRIVSYAQPILFKRILRQKAIIDKCIIYFEQCYSNQTATLTSGKPVAFTQSNLKETLCHELESTINCCQQALQKLTTSTIVIPRSSSSTHSTPTTPRKQTLMHASTSVVSSLTTYATTRSFDDIQNRLYHHKAILNLVEPYLTSSKLYAMMNHLKYKVTTDKQILLAYAHIKIHEKHIPFDEPLLPLFKRFAFAYERIIQLWRRVTDSTLIDDCTDDIVIDDTTTIGVRSICFERRMSQREPPAYKDDMAVKDGLIE